MRRLLSLDETRQSPLLKGPYVSLSRPFRQGAPVASLVAEGLLHPHLGERIPRDITHLYSHQERAIRAISAGRTTLVSTGTGSGKTECFLYPVISRCLALRDEEAPPGISAVIVYLMNALAEDQLMRLRGVLAGTDIPFGIYVGKTPERESDVVGVRLRALMAQGIRRSRCSIGDLVAWLDDLLEDDETLFRALIPEVWQVARREGAGGRHGQERHKYLRFQVLREVALSSRQALGLEPRGRMKVEYEGLDAAYPWIQESAHALGISADRLCDGIASVLDYLRRKRILHDPEHEIFTKYWMEGDREIQQGYLPSFLAPNGTKLRRDTTEKPSLVTQWLSARGDTTMRQIARKWDVAADAIGPFLESLFDFLVDRELLVPVRLKGARGRPLPNVHGVYQVNADRLRLNPNRGVQRCRSCRRTTIREEPHDRCPAWLCDGVLEWVREDDDNYNLQLLDGAYSMLRPEEHTAMVPQTERQRLENLFKGSLDAVNCLVCTPTLELGSVVGWAEIPFWRTGAMDFSLPRPPATALREYVPGNLIYANGHRFVARRFHRELAEEHAEMPFYEVSTERQAVAPSRHGEGSMLGGQVLRAMTVCDTDLIHTSHISDEEDLRFQLGVAVYGLELGQHTCDRPRGAGRRGCGAVGPDAWRVRSSRSAL